MKLVTETRELIASRELLQNLIQRELRSKYKGTVLGWFWSLINPLAQTLVYTLVFSVFLRVAPPVGAGGLENYSLFLLCGLLPWTFFATVVQGGQNVLLDQASLIKKTYFPRRLLLLSHVGSTFVTFVIEMVVLLAIFQVVGVNAWRWAPLMLVMMSLLAVFGLGLAFALSVANVYFRDVAHFVAIAIQIWFYATPIIYPIALVSQAGSDSWVGSDVAQTVYRANPMLSFIEPFRDMLYMGAWPTWQLVVGAVVWSVAALLMGNLVFRRLEPRLAEEL